MTNFERIKNRTIDEVAEQIFSTTDSSLMDSICLARHCIYEEPVGENCLECVKEWLEKEIEDE